MTELREAFLRFSRACAEDCPLYAHLSRCVAEAPDILTLAAGGLAGHPPPNLLFGAVHYLLLRGEQHALRSFYSSVGGDRDPAESWPVFRQFCRVHECEIARLVTSRRVQTNDVGRCGVLLPAFASVQRLFRRPLFMIEVGTSAGLALVFDRYRYEFSNGRFVGAPGTAVVRTALCGSLRPRDLEMPLVLGRVGVDRAPIDVTDSDAALWLEALIWPEPGERRALHRAAVAIRRALSPMVIAGDGLEFVPRLVAAVNGDALPCVFHSHATYQMTDDWRAAFRTVFERLGAARDLALVGLEWLDAEQCSRLHLTTWAGGAVREEHLADCHPHGRWMRWYSSMFGREAATA